jgi:regulator of cell morphogenesis and NO signaling
MRLLRWHVAIKMSLQFQRLCPRRKPPMALESLENLITDHREMEQVFDELESLIAQSFVTSEVSGALRPTLARISQYLERNLAVHARKEDEGLFPLMGRFVPLADGPIAAMLGEHAEIEYLGAELAEGLARLLRESSDSAAAQVRELGTSLIRKFRSRMREEENILFPILQNLLSREDDQAMLEKFAAIDSHAATVSQ